MPQGFFLNPAALRELVSQDGRGLVYADTMARAFRVMNEAKRRCPVKSGRLKGSIRIQPMAGGPAGFYVRVGTDVEYAAAVHNGTKPHVITPTNANVLHFQIGGEDVYAMSVHHPGTRGQPFLTDALELARL